MCALPTLLGASGTHMLPSVPWPAATSAALVPPELPVGAGGEQPARETPAPHAAAKTAGAASPPAGSVVAAGPPTPGARAMSACEDAVRAGEGARYVIQLNDIPVCVVLSRVGLLFYVLATRQG